MFKFMLYKLYNFKDNCLESINNLFVGGTENILNNEFFLEEIKNELCEKIAEILNIVEHKDNYINKSLDK